MRIGVVYYGVLINDWEEHLIKHLERTVRSGLYNAAELFYISVVDFDNQLDKLAPILQKYPKLILDYHTQITPNNPDRSLKFQGEYWGVKMIDALGKSHDDMCLLYFHSKGVVNKWKNFETKEYSERRVKCVADWVETMMYYLVDRWQESVNKLVNEGYDTVGVTNVHRWWWGNFWWTKSSHVQKNIHFVPLSRWYCEAWLHEGRDNSEWEKTKFYEWWHWKFDAFFTDQPRFLYDGTYSTVGKKLVIHKAQYGYQTHQRDEAYDAVIEHLVDVTDKVRSMLSENDTKLFLHVNEQMLGIDEIPTNNKRTEKSLFVTYSFEDRPDDILQYANLHCPVELPIPQPTTIKIGE